jgi:DNA-binding transcriptional LysR family regulator
MSSAMNIRHLRAVAAIVEAGSISGAARSVNLTQPAITQGVAKLEAQIGTLLFERRPGGMHPTEAARILMPRILAAVRLIANARVTSTQMRAFIALARAGSYSGAAARNGLSEASLHRAVGDLEVGLGLRLVERRGRGIALTARGNAIARNFRLADAELSSARAELAAMTGREIGRIAIGAMPLSRARLLPNSLVSFHRDHGEVDVAIVEGSHAELVGPLRDGELDMMLGALRDPAPASDLVQQRLFVDRPVILARAGHPLAGRGSAIAAADLARFEWIVPGEGTPIRNQWRQMFGAVGLAAPRVPIESGSVMTIRQLLVQGDFLTLLSSDQVAVELEAGWLVEIAPAPGDLSRVIGITTRADWRPTGMQRRFIAILEREALRLGGAQDDL